MDPSTGLYNYLRFHADIKALEREEEGGECSEPSRPSSAKVYTCHGVHSNIYIHTQAIEHLEHIDTGCYPLC